MVSFLRSLSYPPFSLKLLGSVIRNMFITNESVSCSIKKNILVTSLACSDFLPEVV